MFCSTCGSPNADDAKFCRNCGTALGTDGDQNQAAIPNSGENNGEPRLVVGEHRCPQCGSQNIKVIVPENTLDVEAATKKRTAALIAMGALLVILTVLTVAFNPKMVEMGRSAASAFKIELVGIIYVAYKTRQIGKAKRETSAATGTCERCGAAVALSASRQ